MSAPSRNVALSIPDSGTAEMGRSAHCGNWAASSRRTRVVSTNTSLELPADIYLSLVKERALRAGSRLYGSVRAGREPPRGTSHREGTRSGADARVVGGFSSAAHGREAPR